jgi:ABC-type bacteriocin/lantibiotic exporters, contain an N-terminal double-glycine peptidase domain
MFKKYAYWGLWTSATMTYGVYALPVAMVVMGTVMVSKGITTVGVLVALWSCMGALIEPVTRLTHANNSIQAAIPAAERVFSLLKEEGETGGGDKAPPEKAPSINAEDLWFRYGESWVLKGVNMNMEQGEKIALVGSSGSGKSTLIDILLSFNQPDRGRALMDNEDLRNYDLNKLRDWTGVARQSDFLFNLSVKDNITLGDYSQERFERALEISQVSEFVYDLPHGVDTIIGERGLFLSDGQKQRIAIARALYKEPLLLILDEATSTIDSRIENMILSNLKALDATMIVVAHRLSTVKNMDSILFLRDGKIMYKGSHQEILKYPEYMELFEKQI